jgi:hypothetical protein
MTEREIDTAIDRAVRDLMNVDTDAAFRARVTARLQRPARRLLLPRLAAAALTVAAVAAAVIWMRPSAPGAPASAPKTEARGPVAVAPPQTETARSNRGAVLPTTAALSPARARTAAEAIPRGALVATVADAPASTIAPLTSLDPIDVEPIAQVSIAPPEIVVAPLTPISEMQISPLDPLTARD